MLDWGFFFIAFIVNIRHNAIFNKLGEEDLLAE